MAICRRRVVNVPANDSETSHQVSARDAYILVDCSQMGSDNYMVYLPTAVGNEGMEVWVVKQDSNEASQVQIVPEDDEEIDGEDTWNIAYQFHAVHLVSDGENWWVAATFGGFGVDDQFDHISANSATIANSLTLSTGSEANMLGIMLLAMLKLGSTVVAFADSPYTVPTAAGSNSVILANTASGSIVANLPAIATLTRARVAVVQKTSASNIVTIVPNGSDTINGAASSILRANGETIVLYVPAAGTDWKVLSWSGKSNVIHVSGTTVANVSTAETDLANVTIPANTVDKEGKELILQAGGTIGSDTIRLRAYLGASLIYDSGSGVHNGMWLINVTIQRVASSDSRVLGTLHISDPTATGYEGPLVTTIARDFTTDLVLRVTAVGTASNKVDLRAIKIFTRE